MSNLYVETNTNTSFPGAGATNASNPLPPITGNKTTTGGSGGSGNGVGAAAGSGKPSDATSVGLPVVGALVAAGFAVMGAMF